MSYVNYLVARAEMAVRDCRWGDGPGGTEPEKKDIFQIFEEAEERKKELEKRK